MRPEEIILDKIEVSTYAYVHIVYVLRLKLFEVRWCDYGVERGASFLDLRTAIKHADIRAQKLSK